MRCRNGSSSVATAAAAAAQRPRGSACRLRVCVLGWRQRAGGSASFSPPGGGGRPCPTGGDSHGAAAEDCITTTDRSGVGCEEYLGAAATCADCLGESAGESLGAAATRTGHPADASRWRLGAVATVAQCFGAAVEQHCGAASQGQRVRGAHSRLPLQRRPGPAARRGGHQLRCGLRQAAGPLCFPRRHQPRARSRFPRTLSRASFRLACAGAPQYPAPRAHTVSHQRSEGIKNAQGPRTPLQFCFVLPQRLPEK
mmetsp:Transcript_39815/g.113704  ORF Transcript_39815/g.113704 Transcript_39815/m.113704 type:complete len:255 (-) Transcript_39815:638-1402(-)